MVNISSQVSLRTMVQYRGIKDDEDSSENDRRNMNSNLLETSLHRTDEVKVVSRGAPQVSDAGNRGDLVIGVCGRKRWRKIGFD